MEKAAVTAQGFRHRRLLKRSAVHLLLACFAMPLFANTPNAEELKALVIKSENKLCFTAQESIFTLEIPGLEASKLQASLQTLPDGIQFLSSRRDIYFDDARLESGTRLQLFFSFSKTGTITIPPLTVTIANRRYKIPFQTVTVYENLETLNPKLTVTLSDELQHQIDSKGILHVPAGSEVQFSVAVRFCVQLVKFSWQLPKNAIFRELTRNDIANGAFFGKSFSPETHELATFSWTPLTEGMCTLPDISITAVAYNGMKKNIALPQIAVSVEKNAALAASAKQSAPTTVREQTVLASADFQTAFEAATAPATGEDDESASREPFVVDCKLLSELRSAERNSFPFDKSRRLRAEYEAKAQLSAPKEARVRIAQLFYALFALSCVLIVLLALKKHVKRTAVTVALAVGLLVLSIHWTLKLAPEYAIFTGGKLMTIPEEQATSTHIEQAGERVRILETAGSWVYILTAESGGWVREGALYRIR